MPKPRKTGTLSTIAQFRREVEKGIRERAKGVSVFWTDGPMRVRYPTGLMGYRGQFTVSGGGMAEAVTYLATYDKNTDGPHTLTVKPLV